MPLREELQSQGDFLFERRGYLPLILVGVGLAIKIHQERYAPLSTESFVAESLEAMSVGVGVLGLMVRALTVGYTPGKTSGRNTSEGQVADVLNTTGAYSVVRNPLYLGNYLMWSSVAMVTGSLWFVVLFSMLFWLYYERIIYAEEEFLRQRFGGRYEDWAESTPAFIPRRFPLERPPLPFSWRKVVRNEKNGLLALFALFCIFGLAGDAAAGEFSIAEERDSLLCAAGAAVLYLCAKGVNRTSHLLREGGR